MLLSKGKNSHVTLKEKTQGSLNILILDFLQFPCQFLQISRATTRVMWKGFQEGFKEG